MSRDMAQETTRPTHELYIELCRMSGRGLTGTPEYRALNAEYQTALDRAIREQPPYHELCGQRHWNACPMLWGGERDA